MARHRGAGYRRALEWMALNDDCYWLADEEPMCSVTAVMVADLWDHPQEKVTADLRRTLKRLMPDHPALRSKA